MLQFILATAAAFCFGKHTGYGEVRRPEPTWPDSSASSKRRDGAACPADRAPCAIHMPPGFSILVALVSTSALKIVSILLASAAMSGLAIIIHGCTPVYAHDWYPFECCARNDCVPASGIEDDGRGGTVVIVEDLRVAIPEGFASRQSLDGRIHVCFRAYPNEIDGSTAIIPICLFLPAQA